MRGFLAKPMKAVIFHFKLCADFYWTSFIRKAAGYFNSHTSQSMARFLKEKCWLTFKEATSLYTPGRFLSVFFF